MTICCSSSNEGVLQAGAPAVEGKTATEASGELDKIAQSVQLNYAFRKRQRHHFVTRLSNKRIKSCISEIRNRDTLDSILSASHRHNAINQSASEIKRRRSRQRHVKSRKTVGGDNSAVLSSSKLADNPTAAAGKQLGDTELHHHRQHSRRSHHTSSPYFSSLEVDDDDSAVNLPRLPRRSPAASRSPPPQLKLPPNSSSKKINAAPSLNTLIQNRYQVVAILGEGSFGHVTKCIDTKLSLLAPPHSHARRAPPRYVALKCLKRLDDNKGALKEIRILSRLCQHDPENEHHCIQPIDMFQDCHSLQHCLVFPLLSISVFDFLKRNDFQPFPTHQVQSIFRQTCEAVAFMHRLDIIHTDLKPENMMFVNGAYDEVVNSVSSNSSASKQRMRVLRDVTIKLIDFGISAFKEECGSRTIQTRHYRAPEVLLELSWSFSADVWSLGCILFELIYGWALFMIHENVEHLALIERLLGQPMPAGMIRRSRYRKDYYQSCETEAGECAKYALKFDWGGKRGRKLAKRLDHLGVYWMQQKTQLGRRAMDLTRVMLCYEPAQRLTAYEAMKHTFFS